LKKLSLILLNVFLLTLMASFALAVGAETDAAPANQTEGQTAATADENDTTFIPSNDTTNAGVDIAAANASENASTAAGSSESRSPAAPISMQGIWKASMAGTDITMALNQSGESVFGQAKFEGENPWNGIVSGSLSGNSIHLSLAYMQGDVLASAYLGGTIEGDSFTGSYVRSDSSGKAARGDLAATMISPDTSGYTPATVAPATAAPVAETVSEAAAKEESAQQTINITQSAAEPAAATATSQSKFKDVTQLAKGINPNILPRMAPL
jgi:hypothetical protein